MTEKDYVLIGERGKLTHVKAIQYVETTESGFEDGKRWSETYRNDHEVFGFAARDDNGLLLAHSGLYRDWESKLVVRSTGMLLALDSWVVKDERGAATVLDEEPLWMTTEESCLIGYDDVDRYAYCGELLLRREDARICMGPAGHDPSTEHLVTHEKWPAHTHRITDRLSNGWVIGTREERWTPKEEA